AVAGKPCELPPLRSDYFAYTRWQLDPARQPARQPHVAFWKARLAGATAHGPPPDLHRAQTRTLSGERLVSRLSPASVDALKLAGRRAHVTTFVIFLTAFAALLTRIARETDIVVGIPVGARPSSEFDDVVGFFATVVPCRIALDGGADATAAAAQVRERVREA